MDRHAARRRILSSLQTSKSLTELADDTGVTDARLLWHLEQMREDRQIELDDDARWVRTPGGSRTLDAPRPEAVGRVFPQRVVDDFEDAVIEAENGLYGTVFMQASGEHRGRLSKEQATEFLDRLVDLVEEYFAPERGDPTGIKHGFHWVLTPIDLHPLGED